MLEPYNTYRIYKLLLYITLYLIVEQNILPFLKSDFDILNTLCAALVVMLPFYTLTFGSKIVSILGIYELIMCHYFINFWSC